MSFWALLLLAFAMSTDAFAVSVCKGVSLKVPRFVDALKVGVLFGVVEAVTPILGWLLGFIALQYIEQWDHWIIFVLMFGLGIRMIYNSFNNKTPCVTNEPQSSSLIMLILAAISTSLDAFAVGVGLALATVNISLAAGMIGLVTCIMVTVGILLGKKIGCLIGKKAELLGGLVLIFIGSLTLYQHLVA